VEIDMKLTRAQLNDPQYHGMPLWFVIDDYDHRPRMQAAIVKLNDGVLTVWGYSTWKQQGAYRTIGMAFDKWTSGRPQFCGNMTVASPAKWTCYTTKAEMFAHEGVVEADPKRLPSDNWLKTQVAAGLLRAEKSATAKTITESQYVEAARSAGLLAELCILVDYDPDVGSVNEHWEPRYMQFARELLNSGGHRAA
jgi:hypothetical protein